MSDQPPPLTRTGKVLSFVVIVGVVLAGYVSGAAWPAIPLGVVLLLWTADRGQHRWLRDLFPDLPLAYTVGVSVLGSMVNNLIFASLGFVLGRCTRLFWWDVMEGRAGAWEELAYWLAGALVVAIVGQGFWWYLEREGQRPD